MTTTSTTPAVSTPLSRDQAGGLLAQTMGLVALTAGFGAAGYATRRDLTPLARYFFCFSRSSAAVTTRELTSGFDGCDRSPSAGELAPVHSS